MILLLILFSVTNISKNNYIRTTYLSIEWNKQYHHNVINSSNTATVVTAMTLATTMDNSHEQMKEESHNQSIVSFQSNVI